MDVFKLSRDWFDWCFENPEKIKPAHTALYFFCIEHCNRLGWKEKFGLPTTMAKEAIGIKSYNTYIETLNDIKDFGFIIILERSKNQYSTNIIALSNFNKALDKALDKALIKHDTKQSESTSESISSIDIQETINNKQETRNNISVSLETSKTVFSFENSLLEIGVEKQIASDWMKVRKSKKATNSETAFNAIYREVLKSGLTANECITISVERSWQGFKSEWLENAKQPNQPKSNISNLIHKTYEQF